MQGELFPLPVITKVVFLDFDEVLMTARSKLATQDFIEHCSIPNKPRSVVDPVAIWFLNELCRELNAAIVITSSWKSHANDEARRLLANAGYKRRIHNDWRCDAGEGAARRGQGIINWQQNHPEVQDWVIIDDAVDYYPHQLPRTVVIPDMYNGITFENMQEAHNILHGNSRPEFNLSWQTFIGIWPQEPIVHGLRRNFMRQKNTANWHRKQRSLNPNAKRELKQITRQKKGGPQPA